MKHVEGLSQREIHRAPEPTATRSAERWLSQSPRAMARGRSGPPSSTRSWQTSRNCSRTSPGSPACASARRSRRRAMGIKDDPRRSVARTAPALFAAAAQLPAHPLPPRRAGAVRPLRAPLTDPRRLWPETPRLRRHLRAAYSRAFAGALIFCKEFADIAFGMRRCLERLGACRASSVGPRGRDRAEGASHAGLPRLLR